MKNSILFAFLSAALLASLGCKSTHDQGPYLPQNPATPAHEATQPVVLMDPGVQYSVTHSGYQETVLPDGRLQVSVHLRNRENRRVEVQANCVFKNQNGFSTGDETPWQTVILTENGTEDVTFVSANTQARKATVRVRQAR
jgi:uncharacterized protein YcfL